MAVVMISDVPGADADLADGLRAAGVLEQMAAAPGFGGHVSGATESGYRVIEVWDSREAWQNWFNTPVAPNLPPGVHPTPPEFFDLALDIRPAA